jgi:hypothetical protein
VLAGRHEVRSARAANVNEHWRRPIVAGLLTTVAQRGATTYTLDGSIFVTGAAVQWLAETAPAARCCLECAWLRSNERPDVRACAGWTGSPLGPTCAALFSLTGHNARRYCTGDAMASPVYEVVAMERVPKRSRR